MLADYRKSVVAAFSDVEDALAAVAQDQASLDAQNENVRTAKNAFDLSQQQFAGGIVDITAVLNTQRTLFLARDALAQAKLTYLNAIVGLYQALGGGWKNL